MWDARYRENLIGLEYLKNQTIRDDTNFIYVEWTDEPNPKALEYDFLDIYCMNLKKDMSTHPAYDTGLQYNLGTYLARTEWVTFYLFDLISTNQLEVIVNKANAADDNIIYLEGYEINAKARGKNIKMGLKEFDRLIAKHGSNINPYNYTNFGQFVSTPHVNGVLLTVRRDNFINETGGFIWNHHRFTEIWCGIGAAQKRLGGTSLRGWLTKRKKAMLAQKDMIVLTIPHGRENRKIKTELSCVGGIKYYDDFVNDWLTQHNITHYKKRNES
jgi:hypothetical protein